MDSCTNLLTKRQYGDYTDTLIKNKLMAARQFIDRLELEAELVSSEEIFINLFCGFQFQCLPSGWAQWMRQLLRILGEWKVNSICF
jgi:hypothetical protein